MDQQAKITEFRRLHGERPLVLPNAWDAGSARLLEQAGAKAIATTSAGVSWSHGLLDGEKLTRDEMLAVIGRIVRRVAVPVTADIEGGYGGGTPRAVAETARTICGLGVAGINLEDSPGREGQKLLEPQEQASRIGAAREAAQAAGCELFINARIDVFMFEVGDPKTWLAETLRRAAAYLSAGADCVFVPGVIDRETIAALVSGIRGPLNIMAMPGAPSVAELGELGVARVSVGPLFTQAAFAAVRRGVRELLEQGTYGNAEDVLSYGDLRTLLAR
ncbi:MAG TPA: isocitrate lyase/phosphoenolpyruvate mutase family protein [Gammaproteobacteria bacterium]